MAIEWYYYEGDQRIGPVALQQLKDMAESGRLQLNSLVWKEGMANPQRASTLKGLFAASFAAPPTVFAAEVVPTAQSGSSEMNTQKMLSTLWGWYKRYVAFIWTLIWGVLTATFYAAMVIVGDLKNAWESKRLKGQFAQEQAALGETLYTSGWGDTQHRQQIAEKDHAIQQAEASKASTAALTAEKEALLTELAAVGMAAKTGDPLLQQSLKAIQKAQQAIERHEQELATLSATRTPVDKRRAWIGGGVIAVILAAAIADKDRSSYIPHTPGTSREYVHVMYLPGGQGMAQLKKEVHKENGIIETTIQKIGGLEGSKGLFDGGSVEWIENVSIQSKFPCHHRINGGFIEIGSHLAENDEIAWEPVLKVDAKPGDSWEWNPLPEMSTSYLVGDFSTWNGKPAVIVRRESPAGTRDGGIIIRFTTYAMGIGEVESQATWLQPGKTPPIWKAYEQKIIESSVSSSP